MPIYFNTVLKSTIYKLMSVSQSAVVNTQVVKKKEMCFYMHHRWELSTSTYCKNYIRLKTCLCFSDGIVFFFIDVINKIVKK